MQILIEPLGDIGKGQRFADIARAVFDYARNVAEPQVKSYGERIVANWNGPPTFVTKSEIKGGDLIISCEPVGPNAQKWAWVSKGVPKREPMRARPDNPKGVMIFPSTFTPKTRPRGATVQYGGSGTYGGSLVYASEVNWPGIKPRNFERAWANWARLWFPKGVADAIARAKID